MVKDSSLEDPSRLQQVMESLSGYAPGAGRRDSALASLTRAYSFSSHGEERNGGMWHRKRTLQLELGTQPVKEKRRSGGNYPAPTPARHCHVPSTC